jgi:lysophospholipase L1-like esterase
MKQKEFFKLVIGNLLVLGFLLAGICGIGEIYCRFFHDSTDSFGLTLGCQRWFQRHYHFNSTGVRDNIEYKTSGPRNSSCRRITFIGDSFTAGHGVPDVNKRFANLIRGKKPEWEIHVFAANGLDTGAEIEMLQKAIASNYQLDTVVLVYCLNDISDIVPEWDRILSRIYTPNVLEQSWPVRKSFFLNTLYYRSKSLFNPDTSNYYGFVKEAYEGNLWTRQQARLKLIRDTYRTNDAKLLVVTFPFLHELGDHYEYAGVHKQLDAFWAGLGVPHLDLLSTYSGMKNSSLVVNKHDAHPNEKAHRLAADAITGFLEKNMD